MSFWAWVGMAAVWAQGWWYVKTWRDTCPECRETGILDVSRHRAIFHPGLFDELDPDIPGFGLDPRPSEDPFQAMPGRLREWRDSHSQVS